MRSNDPYPVKVLVAPGKVVPLESLPEKEQNEVEAQLRLVSEVAQIDFPEDDEWVL
jgi:hypothetical protein